MAPGLVWEWIQGDWDHGSMHWVVVVVVVKETEWYKHDPREGSYSRYSLVFWGWRSKTGHKMGM